jgi:hypothetical protein
MSNYEIKINAINIRDVQVALRDWCSALHVMPDLDPDEVLETIGLEVVREWFERQMFALDAKVEIVPLGDAPSKPVREKKPKMTKEAAKAMLSEESLEDSQSNDSEWP